MLSKSVSSSVAVLTLVFSTLISTKSFAAEPEQSEIFAACMEKTSTKQLLAAMVSADKVVRGGIEGWREQLQLPRNQENINKTVSFLESQRTPKRGAIHIRGYDPSNKEFGSKLQAAANCGEMQILIIVQTKKMSDLACHLLETVGKDEGVPQCALETASNI